MAEVILSANSKAWGSTLRLTSTFTWQTDGYDTNVTVNIKTVMSLKSGAGTLNITPPVYSRIYCGGVCVAEVKNTKSISHHSTNTDYVLFEKTVSLSRGASYDFELEYSNANLNGVNIGINTQRATKWINDRTLPTINITKAAVTSETLNANDTTKKTVTLNITANIDPQIASVWACYYDVYDGNTVLEDYSHVFPNTDKQTSASFSKTINLSKDKAYTIRGRIIQSGVWKDFEIKVVAWQPLVTINKLEITTRTHNTLGVKVTATGSVKQYVFVLKNASGAVVHTSNPQTGNAYTFTQLSPETDYTVEVTATDTRAFSAKKTVAGRTAAAPELVGFVVDNGVLKQCTLYYCDKTANRFRAIKAAAVIKDGVVKTVTSPQS